VVLKRMAPWVCRADFWIAEVIGQNLKSAY
jgi:hypothetical protein